MADITTRLRQWTHDVAAVPASDLMDEAANEIDRLRGYRDIAEADRDVAMLAAERLRLTDEERDAIDAAATAVMLEDNNISTVLWDLLKRTKRRS